MTLPVGQHFLHFLHIGHKAESVSPFGSLQVGTGLVPVQMSVADGVVFETFVAETSNDSEAFCG